MGVVSLVVGEDWKNGIAFKILVPLYSRGGIPGEVCKITGCSY